MRTKPTILFLTASILVLFINRLHGQQRCGTAEFEANKMSRNPELIFYKENSNRYLQQYRNNVGTNQRLATSNIQIPVVFHLIGDVVIANVLYSKLEDQITILNSAYSGVYGGFNTNIQFCLAKIDPTGVTTTGEDPITGSYPSWDPCAASTASNSNEVLKALTHWEPTQYLNIYIVENISCPSKPILGYSTFPYELSGHPNDDGVVIDYDYFGTTSNTHFGLGFTTVHEVGHWLGLYHTWGDQDDCSGTDYMFDTPYCSGQNYADQTSGCTPHPNQCTTENDNAGSTDLRQIENFMDYSDDGCMSKFTNDQSNWMGYSIATFRNPANFISCAEHCFNQLQDVDEAGIDCGGADCHPCNMPPHCSNGVLDGDEFEIDCGGVDCSPCPSGGGCVGDFTTGLEYQSVCFISGSEPSGPCGPIDRWENYTISPSNAGCNFMGADQANGADRVVCSTGTITIESEFYFFAGIGQWQGQNFPINLRLWVCSGPHPQVRKKNENSNIKLFNIVNDIKVYPNPSYSTLHISGTNLSTIQLFDMLGRCAMIKKINNVETLELDISNLTSGSYFLNIECTDGSNVFKKVIHE